MSTILARYWPIFTVLIFFWGLMAVLVYMAMGHSDGRLIYPLDDTYIHMAIAGNTVIHEVWGVTKHAFSSTTSSPLWTFLLSIVYIIFGVNDWAPLFLNILSGTVLMVVTGLFLIKTILPGDAPASRRLVVFGILLAALLAAPLPTVTMIGIEHVLHTLLTISFLGCAVLVLGSPSSKINASLYLILLAPLLTMTRYEGLFLVFVVCVLMLFQKKWPGAVLTGAAALLPVTVYGIWSVSKGWFFLPNSLLLKGQMPEYNFRELAAMIQRTLIELQSNPHLLILLIASLVLILLYRMKPSDYRLYYAHMIYSGTLLLHLTFASTGWLYRYEAYLVFTGIVITGASVISWIPDPGRSGSGANHKPEFHDRLTGRVTAVVAALILAGVVAYPFVHRAVYSYLLTPRASGNIYEQQYHMGRFLNTYYQDAAVAVNDIGAVTWLADIQLLDLVGLGSLEPAALRRNGRYTTEAIDRLARKKNIEIAIVYDDWYDGELLPGLPPEWQRVAQWRIYGNVIAGSDVVSFYAVNPAGKHDLIHNLNRFSEELPPDVEVSGLLPSQ